MLPNGAIEVNLVVPARNAEPYLEQFFDCIRSQTYQGFRVIFVDDASEDNTLHLARKLGAGLKDRFVALGSSEHLGLSGARNLGLDWVCEHPTVYLGFLDIDDWFEREYLEDLYVMAEAAQADLCIAGIKRIDEATGRVTTTEMVSYPQWSPYRDLSACDHLAFVNPCSYAKLFRFDRVAHVRFRTILRSEDTCYLFDALPFLSCVAFTNRAHYYYCVRNDSLSASVSIKTRESMHAVFSEMLMQFSKPPYAAFRELFEAQVFIRSSIGAVLRESASEGTSLQAIARSERAWLDRAMPTWKSNRFLTQSLTNRNASWKQRAVGVCAQLYKWGYFPLFIRAYQLFVRIFGREVRV